MKHLEFLTGNWGLKALALVLAVVLYHAVRQSLVLGAAQPSPQNEQRHPARQ